MPGHLLGLRRPWPPAPPTRLEQRPGRVARSRPFLALTITLALAAAASYAVVLNLVPLLTDRGMTTTTAAVVLGVGGAGQVLGRLAFPVLSRLLKVRGRTVLVVGGVALTTALLAALTSLPAVVVAATLAGAVRGMLTLLNATAVTDRWAAGHYGRLTGLLSAPVAVTAALSPWVGAIVAAALHGYDSMVWVMSAVAAAAALIGLASVPGRGDGDAAYTYKSLRGRSRPATRWKAGPRSLTSILQTVDPPHEIGWTGTTLGIKAVHVFRFEPRNGGTLPRSEESWDGLIARLFSGYSRKRSTTASDVSWPSSRMKPNAALPPPNAANR